MVNIPVDASNVAPSDGLNCFWNIGLVPLWRVKLVLFDLLPFIASYWASDSDSVTVPYCKSSGKFNKSISV